MFEFDLTLINVLSFGAQIDFLMVPMISGGNFSAKSNFASTFECLVAFWYCKWPNLSLVVPNQILSQEDLGFDDSIEFRMSNLIGLHVWFVLQIFDRISSFWNCWIFYASGVLQVSH